MPTPTAPRPKRVCARPQKAPPALVNPFHTWLRPVEPTAQELTERAERNCFELWLAPLPTDLDEHELFHLYLEELPYCPPLRQMLRTHIPIGRRRDHHHERQYRKYRPNHPANAHLSSYPAWLRGLSRHLPRYIVDHPDRNKWLGKLQAQEVIHGRIRSHLTEHEKEYERWRRRFQARKDYTREYKRRKRAEARKGATPPVLGYARWLQRQRWSERRPAKGALELALRDPALFDQHQTKLLSHPRVGPAARAQERDREWWAIAIGACVFDCSPTVTKTILRRING